MQKILLLLILSPSFSFSQDANANSQPSFVVGISFHAVSTPFHKPGNNFRNLGFKIGAEIPWNSKDNLRQAVEVGYYFNKLNGRSIYVHSDFVYRPKITHEVRAEFRIGPGVGLILAPGKSYIQREGVWSVARGGKWFPQVHGAVGISYNDLRLQSSEVSPYVQYEVMAIVGYNRGIPVLPNSFIHMGTKMKF